LNAKCGVLLAELARNISNFSFSSQRLCSEGTLLVIDDTLDTEKKNDRRGLKKKSDPSKKNPLKECITWIEDAIETVEKRQVVSAFEKCSRACGLKASGNGIFDGAGILQTVRSLAADLTRPPSGELVNGCQQAIHLTCQNMDFHVQDKDVSDRLGAVAECANALSGDLKCVIEEVAELTNRHVEQVEERLSKDVVLIENFLFSHYLEGVRASIEQFVRSGWGDTEDIDDFEEFSVSFPGYLSSSLLVITRCRAQVESALGETVRINSDGRTYQFLALATASECLIHGMCNEINERMPHLGVQCCSRLVAELHFLMNILKLYLRRETLSHADDVRIRLKDKTEGKGIADNAPEGLHAIEELERLGRVYVLCLGE